MTMLRAGAGLKKVVIWLALLIGAGAIGFALWRTFRIEPMPDPHFVEIGRNVYILPKPDTLATFSLVSHDGKTFDNAALKEKWTFWFFGFTHCPDICPVTLGVFDRVHKMLNARTDGAIENVHFVFVSVDPERDTPELLNKYVPQFNPAFLGVTGDSAELARLSESMGVSYGKHEGSTPANYTMDHSSAALLTDPRGKLIGVFAAPHAAQDMLAGLLKIRQQAESP
jgi:protein SCO1